MNKQKTFCVSLKNKKMTETDNSNIRYSKQKDKQSNLELKLGQPTDRPTHDGN